MAQSALPLPFWARALLLILKLIPGIPGVVVSLVEIALFVISQLPRGERKAAMAEMSEAIRLAKDGHPEHVEQVAKKYWEQCRGRMCPADLVRY